MEAAPKDWPPSWWPRRQSHKRVAYCAIALVVAAAYLVVFSHLGFLGELILGSFRSVTLGPALPRKWSVPRAAAYCWHSCGAIYPGGDRMC
jgi:hypothetical protein